MSSFCAAKCYGQLFKSLPSSKTILLVCVIAGNTLNRGICVLSLVKIDMSNSSFVLVFATGSIEENQTKKKMERIQLKTFVGALLPSEIRWRWKRDPILIGKCPIQVPTTYLPRLL